MTTSARRPAARRLFCTVLAAAVVAALATATNSPALADPPALSVDLGHSTGAFLGGANGALYALAQDNVASDDTVAPLHMRTIAQKPDGGLQHPSGDVDNVAPEFFRTGGSQLFVYMQDDYQFFPYENPGIASYQQTVATIINQVKASPYAKKQVLVPFNEPDNIWYDLHSGDSNYASSSAQYFSDWRAVYRQIRAAMPTALIAGPNTSSYDSTFMRDFLTYCKANGVLPDVTTWHELGDGLTYYRGHYADYRSVEQSVGVSPLPINIDEYASSVDEGNPGAMLPWLALFEDTKVDAMQAYWRITENIQGNVAQNNQANGAWWLMRWYGALTGNTVAVTPPDPNTAGTVQAIATLDTAKRQSRILIGGGSGAVTLAVHNVPADTFGTSVHAEVQRTAYSGYDSASDVPATIAEGSYPVVDGSVQVPLPARGAMDAYQVILTPGASFGSDNGSTPVTTVRYEAENAALTDATVYQQSGDAISNGANVGSIDSADSRVAFTVDAPTAGHYYLDVHYGNETQQPAQEIIKVDDGHWRFVTYRATLSYTYNATLRLDLRLTAGSHTITFGVSDPSIGTATGQVTLDAIDLTPVGTTRTVVPKDTRRYEAEYADLSGAAAVATTSSGYTDSGYVSSASTPSAAASTTFIAAAPTDGYYDLSLRYATPSSAAARVSISVAGQQINPHMLPATGGAWADRPLVVWLKSGINRIAVAQRAGADPVYLDHLDVTPLHGTTLNATTYQAEDGTMAGAAVTQNNAYAAGGRDVGYIGNGALNTLALTVNAPASGTYAIGMAAADNQRGDSNHYNTDLVDRYTDVTIQTGARTTVQRVYVRNTYSWSQYDVRTFYASLTAGANTLTFGNMAAYAPNIDQITVAQLSPTVPRP